MRNVFLCSIAAFVCISGNGSAAPPGANHLLYGQTGGGPLIGIVSQAFDEKYARFDSQGADDFVIPDGQTWIIKQVAATGGYVDGPGPATSENVLFYRDRSGVPGAAVSGGTFLSLNGLQTEGDFNIYLPGKGLKLHRGHYWLSIQANMPHALGWWGWITVTEGQGQGFYPAVWKNPANGYHKGCKKYTIETNCWAEGQ